MTTHVYPPLPPSRRSNIELFHRHDADGPALSSIYYEYGGAGLRAKLLSKDEARRIAAKIAKQRAQ
jgi:hypothetical protein